MEESQKESIVSSDLYTLLDCEDVVDELPFFQLPFHKVKEGLKVIFDASLSTSLSLIYIYSVNLISLGFIGSLKDSVMIGGLGLGILCSNCCAYVTITSLNQGVNVLAAQAFGANKHSLVALSYHRGLFILLIVLIPIFIILGFTKDILIFLNIDPQLAEYASEYIIYAYPSYVFYGIFDCTKSYLYAQNIFKPILYIQTVTTLLHFFWSWLFIIHFEMGPGGAGVAKGIFEFLNTICILTYIPLSKICHENWVPFSKIEWRTSVINWEGLKAFFVIVLPMAALLFLDQACYEVFTLMAGQLGKDQLAVHVDISNTVTIYYSVPFGLSIAVMTYVANAMGKGLVNSAKNYTYFGLIWNLIATILFVIILLIFREQWAQLFGADDEVIKELLLKVLNIYFIFILIDGIQVVLSGTLKGIGKQTAAAIGLFICFYVITIPLIYYFAFHLDMKVSGIWYGFLCGVFLLFLVYLGLIKYSDFKVQMKKIQESLVISENSPNTNEST